MAAGRIRIDDFEDGVLPGVCAGTGAPASRLYQVNATSRMPGWLWLAVFAGPAGILFLALGGSFLRKTARGCLPYADGHQAAMRRRIRGWGLMAAAGLVVAVLALVIRSNVGFANLALLLGAAGLVALLLGLFLWANPPGAVGLTLDSTGRWVELDNVSPAFAAAYEQQEARRRAARRAELEDRPRID
jgi:hypothetical protein